MAALTKVLESAPRFVGLLRSQYWPPPRLDSYRQERLARTLAAAARIPFYAARFGGAPRLENFASLPVLRRADVKGLNASVRSLYRPGAALIHSRSSGSTGMPVEFIFDSSHQRIRYAARARYLRANGWNPIVRSAWFAGSGFIGPAREIDDPDAQLVSRLFFGVRFLSLAIEFRQQAAMMVELDPFFIYVYPSILDGMLRALEETGQRVASLRRIFTGGEPVQDSLRERVRRHLGVEIADNYGSTEAFVGWQCGAGSYHVNAEHVFTEIVDQEGRPVPPGAMGRVLVTTLANYLMPLVRYEIGDYAVAAEGACSCGRTLPILGRVLGRQMNLFRMPDGSLAPSNNLVNFLTACPELTQFQIVQKTTDHFALRYVADTAIAGDSEFRIRTGFGSVLGVNASIGFERVPEIIRAPSGKFMVAYSEVAR